jgi:hypothetical protein
MRQSMMELTGSAVLVLAALGLAGCEKERAPGVFDVSLGEAYRRLSNDKLADMVYAKQCGILIHVAPTGMPVGTTDRQVHLAGPQQRQRGRAIHSIPVGGR